MEAFYQCLLERAATIDELLLERSRPLPGRRIIPSWRHGIPAWCRMCQRGLGTVRPSSSSVTVYPGHVLVGFPTSAAKAAARPPLSVEDAFWIGTCARSTTAERGWARPLGEPCVRTLLLPVVERAEALLWTGLSARRSRTLLRPRAPSLALCFSTDYPIFVLRPSTSDLPRRAPARHRRIRFRRDRTIGTLRYDQFVADMKAGGSTTPVRRKAGASAVDCDAHAAVDRFLTRVRLSP